MIIKLVSPQATQLSNHFFRINPPPQGTRLRTRNRREKSPAPGRIQNYDLLITRHVLHPRHPLQPQHKVNSILDKFIIGKADSALIYSRVNFWSHLVARTHLLIHYNREHLFQKQSFKLLNVYIFHFHLVQVLWKGIQVNCSLGL